MNSNAVITLAGALLLARTHKRLAKFIEEYDEECRRAWDAKLMSILENEETYRSLTSAEEREVSFIPKLRLVEKVLFAYGLSLAVLFYGILELSRRE